MNFPPVVVNTHSSYEDVWTVLSLTIEKYLGTSKIYLFSNRFPSKDIGQVFIQYDSSDDFRSQFLSCLSKVSEDYLITINDDYFLTAKPDFQLVLEYLDILRSNPAISFIRLLKGYNTSNVNFTHPNLFFTDPSKPFLFTQGATLWRKRDLLMTYSLTPKSGIGRKANELQSEVLSDNVARTTGMIGLYHFAGEPKRGESHYDSIVLPHIASSIVGGKWNFKEYKSDLLSLLHAAGVDYYSRGVF